MRRLCLTVSISLLLAGSLYAAAPANDAPPDEEQKTTPQADPVNVTKQPARAPAISFTPSEKVSADSAVSFPVDI